MPGVSIPNLLKDMSSREATYITVQNPKSHTLPKLQITKDEIGTILLKTEILKTMNNNNKKKDTLQRKTQLLSYLSVAVWACLTLKDCFFLKKKKKKPNQVS